MRILIFLLFFSIAVCSAEESEDLQDFLDLELDEKGGALFQTAPDGAGGQLFLLKQIFPSATSTKVDGIKQSPSLVSTRDGVTEDGKYSLFVTVGQVIAGSSEDTAHFRMKAGFFNSARKSVYRVRGIRTRRTPISAPRGF